VTPGCYHLSVLKEQHFEVGDKAVYPVHGVAEVVALEQRDVGGSKVPVYILKIIDSGLKIMVPTTNVGSVGLRDLITSKQVKEVYSILKSRDIPRDTQTWNRRYREYMEKIKTGSVFEIAEVLRDLCVLRLTKELSFGERKMLETARTLIVKELALAKGVGDDKIATEIDTIFQPAAA
jgi:CarD family transcriptional regulator